MHSSPNMADTASTEPAAQAAQAAQAGSSTQTPTILTHLHSLLSSQTTLLSQSSLPVALPYLHPYAPSPYKGKARAPLQSSSDQLEVLKSLKQAVDQASGVLERSKDDGRVKFLRALKDVSNHQAALLPTTNALSTLVPATSSHPTHRIQLPPIQLLKSLAESLAIQIYLEDSQFGLLKTSLTLAGSSFVVDLDIETDSVGGNAVEDEDMEDDADTTAESKAETKGKVRLSKISSNHVRGDATGKSDWVAKVLREILERYLGVWNMEDRTWETKLKLEACVQELENELRDLKELDAVAEAGSGQEGKGADWFADLEAVAAKIQAEGSKDSPALFPEGPHIFPQFQLVPGGKTVFRLRPTREQVAVPDGLSDDIEESWLTGTWVLEHVGDGFVVRRSWLLEDAEDAEPNWDGLMRVEHLLYRDNDNGFVPFPYMEEFEPVQGQRWSIADPGPEGFVVGRIGIPKSFEGLVRLLERLRKQVVLNELFSSVFRSDYLDLSEGDDAVDLLEGPAAVPATVSLKETSIKVSAPVQGTMIELIITPVTQAPFVGITNGTGLESTGRGISAVLAAGGVSARDLSRLLSGVSEHE